MSLKTDTPMILHSSCRSLEKGFDRLKREALRWVFEGWPVGDYYEAALPGRDAFCMRDTCHQCVGAEALGLSAHNYNMFRKFASSISASRDYCGYWEIDRYDRPCPVDYADDSDFWYNLPANFDVVDACYRMYRHTGDRRYLEDADIERFCALSMEDYVRRWDRDGDGLPDRRELDGRRGIASYDESELSMRGLKVGVDLVCAMARAYFSCAEMCRLTNRPEYARSYLKRANELKKTLLTQWWSPEKGLALGMDRNGALCFDPSDPWKAKNLLYRGLAEPEQADSILDALLAGADGTIIELFCHLPEILWKYGRPREAVTALRRAMDPELPRRDYPEASFSAIGAIVTGLMGIEPDGETRRVATLSGLGDVEWAALEHVRVLDGYVSVEHTGQTRTECVNECAAPILWRARFPGEHSIRVNGRPASAQTETMACSGMLVSCVNVPLAPWETVVAQIDT